LQEERFILIHGVKDFRPWLLGSSASRPVMRQNVMVGNMRKGTAAHLMVIRKQKDREEAVRDKMTCNDMSSMTYFLQLSLTS
jgi:hypothetical protein